jgi:hypothetical protein
MPAELYWIWRAELTPGLSVGALVLWVALAFTLWVFLTGGLRTPHLYGAVVLAAFLSWLAAGLVVWGAPLVVQWLDSWMNLTG